MLILHLSTSLQDMLTVLGVTAFLLATDFMWASPIGCGGREGETTCHRWGEGAMRLTLKQNKPEHTYLATTVQAGFQEESLLWWVGYYDIDSWETALQRSLLTPLYSLVWMPLFSLLSISLGLCWRKTAGCFKGCGAWRGRLANRNMWSLSNTIFALREGETGRRKVNGW